MSDTTELPEQNAQEQKRRSRNKRDYLYEIKDIAGDILGPESPVYDCMHLVTSPEGVKVSFDGDRGFIENVATCKQVHTCPICAKIAAQKWAKTITKICAVAARDGLSALMLVVTGKHKLSDPFKPLLEGVIESWRFVFSGDRSGERECLARVKYQIKHIEVRYSSNGYHPHLHILLFVDERDMSTEEKAIFEDKLAQVIYSRYKSKLERLGFTVEPVGYYCEPVKIWGAAKKYIHKIEMELTQSENKQSEYSYSMFQLLALYKQGQKTVFGRPIEDIYREYAAGMKWRRNYTISENLLKELGIDLKALEELENDSQEKQESPVLLATVDTQLWWYLVRTKQVIDLLHVADTGDSGKVEAFLFSRTQDMELTRRAQNLNIPPVSDLPEDPPWMDYTD